MILCVGAQERSFMNKWYRKTVTKVVLLVVAIISGAVCITSLLGALTLAGTSNPAEVWKLAGQPFEESADFNSMVQGMMRQVMERIRLERMFETDGSYSPDKLVDVVEYTKSGRISGENTSGVAYTLEELENWSEDYNSGEGDIYDTNSVIVCERTDGSYYYYYLSDFITLLDNGQLSLEMEDPDDTPEFLNGLENGELTSSGFYEFRILNSSGEIEYTDCWNFGQALREKYAPDGAENLLQVVNGNPQLNGKLSIIYDDIASVLNSIYSDYQTYQSGWAYLGEGNTNFTYLYINEETKWVETNRSGYESYENAAENIKSMKSGDSVKYMIVYPKLGDFETNMSISASSEWDAVRSYENRRNFNSTFAVAVDTDFPIRDQFYEGKINYEQNAPFLQHSLILAIVSGTLFLIAAVWLTMAAGRNEKDDELRLTAFDRWKTEIAAAVVIGVWICGTWLFAMSGSGISTVSQAADSASYYMDAYSYDAPLNYYTGLFTNMLSLFDITALFLYGLFTFSCFFLGYLSLVKRIKGKRLWADSLCRMLISFGAVVIGERAVTTKAAVIAGVFVILQWVALASGGSTVLVLLMLAVDIAVIYFILSNAVAKGRLKKGIEEISSGNMNYKVPLGGLQGANRKLAEQLNDIGGGLNKAVEEGMKNERLKTDLITNVSHDIKTPLTSIINYVDILKRENIQDPKIRGYLDILEAKAQRLKTLTEDVVEASKVSSGNIVLEYMDVDLVEMIQQTEGEFAEKFAARNLSVVVNLPEEPAVIHVDGRRMWRVLENIFGNAAKYAMPGTRVYADLSVDEENVSFSLKNVSEQQLNISADELTERFIRGDISRSTEGSGLGLSIAKSLAEMQGGRFELYLDGDLFRVNIRFPRVRR